MSIAHPDAHANGHPLDLDNIPPPGEETPRSPHQALAALLGYDVADLGQLRAAVEEATELGRIDYATLAQARSQEEITAEVAQARRHREDTRDQADLDHQEEIRRRTRDRDYERQREDAVARHQHELQLSQQQHEQASQAAQQQQEQILHPAHEVVASQRWHWWLPKLTFVPGVVAALVSALNLGTQGSRIIAPSLAGGALGTGLDLVFTLALIVLALARMSSAVLGEDTHNHRRWYGAGEFALTAALGTASVMAHALPSANGAPHDSMLGVWCLLIPVGLAFTTIFAPMTSTDTRLRFVRAGREAALSRPYGGLDGAEARVLRLARWIAEQDRQDLVPGERDESGVPSVSGIMRHVREHVGSCSKPLARQIRDYYALVGGRVE